MIHQIPIGRASSFVWVPRYLPDPNQAVTLSLTANGVTSNVTLTARGGFAVTSAPDQYRLRADVAAVESRFGGAESDAFGEWWLHAPGVGQFAVEITSFDDSTNDFILAQPLNIQLPDSFSGTLYHNVFTGSIPSGAVGAAVDRAGVWRIDWSTDPDLNSTGAAFPGQAFTDRGAVRVVRAIFDSGLTASHLMTMVPVLNQTRPTGVSGWQPLIDSLADAVIGEIEHRLPDSRYADQTLGSQWQRAAALLTAAHIAETGYAPNVSGETLRQLASEEFDRQAARVVWLDANDDGEIGASETGVDSASLIGMTRSSGTLTEQSYSDGRRHRFTLNDPDSR